MDHPCRPLALVALALIGAGCARTASSAPRPGSAARLSIDGVTYELSNVSMLIDTGEEPWFRIEGEPAADAHADCVPGLASGMGLYGELPASVSRPSDLAGQRLRVEFSGDGDDANFCFPGMGGLAGAEEAWVTIDSVSGTSVAFSMSGSFRIYDENGDGPVRTASASGTAQLRQEP